MIKRYKFILLIFFLTTSNTHAFNEKNEQQMYIGCYQNSKQYLGSKKAKTYCSCTVRKLSEKFSDQEMDSISAESGEKQLEAFDFASKLCGDKLNLN